MGCAWHQNMFHSCSLALSLQILVDMMGQDPYRSVWEGMRVACLYHLHNVTLSFSDSMLSSIHVHANKKQESQGLHPTIAWIYIYESAYDNCPPKSTWWCNLMNNRWAQAHENCKSQKWQIDRSISRTKICCYVYCPLQQRWVPHYSVLWESGSYVDI